MFIGETIALFVAVAWTATALFAEVGSKRMGSLPLNTVRMTMSLILLVLTLRCRKRVNGEWFAVYLLLYAAGRFFIEGLRTDQLLLPGSQIPVSQLLSAVFAIGAAGFIVWARLRGRGKTGNEQN